MKVVKTQGGKRFLVQRRDPEIALQGACTKAEIAVIDAIIKNNSHEVEGLTINSRRVFVRIASRLLAQHLGYSMPPVDDNEKVIRELPSL